MVRGDAVVGAKFSGQAALTARLMMYVLMAIVLMAMDHRGQYVPKLRAKADYLIEPIYHLVEWPFRAMRGSWSYFQSTQSLVRQNKDLSKQLLAEQAALQRFDALLEENRRLRELLDGSDKLDIEYQFAELIDVDLDPFSHRVVIDRGHDRDVQVGQAVIDGAGVMGQVEEVDLHFSKVRLISDPNHALPVQINRTGLRTVAMGVGSTSRLSIPNLPREADVREGDLVVTSGLGNRFPAGYPVAVIEIVDRNEGRMFAEAFARPLAALDRGREVLLLKSPPPQPLGFETEEPEEGIDSDASPNTEVENDTGQDDLIGATGEESGEEDTAVTEAAGAAGEESPGDGEQTGPADDAEQTP
jgi:rod shape-determining protein MreC